MEWYLPPYLSHVLSDHVRVTPSLFHVKQGEARSRGRVRVYHTPAFLSSMLQISYWNKGSFRGGLTARVLCGILQLLEQEAQHLAP